MGKTSSYKPWAKRLIGGKPMPIELLSKWVSKRFVKYSRETKRDRKRAMLKQVVRAIKDCGYKQFSVDDVKSELVRLYGLYKAARARGDRSDILDRNYTYYESQVGKNKLLDRDEGLVPALIFTGRRYSSNSVKMQINYLRLNYEYYVKTGGPIPKCLRRFTGVVNVFKRHDATLEAIFTRNKEAKEEKRVVETATTAYDEGSETETEDEFITDGTENVLLGPLPEY
ncbi:hypothetical protein JG687_00018011, partial [Phytophthora cactorum]